MNDLERVLRNRYERLEMDEIFEGMDRHVISNFVGETLYGQSAENNLVKTNIVDFFKEK
jgi:hypothetical protein